MAQTTTPSTEDSGLLHDFPPFFRIYKPGRVFRLSGDDVVPPPTTADLLSKDTVVSSSPNLSARLFLPSNPPPPKQKLPLLIYIHGGGFCIQSPFSSLYTSHLSLLTTRLNSLSVSLQYRRAPEHPLPAAYDDVWASVNWIASHRGGTGPDPWLNDNADFDRVLLAGDSAGANLANNVAVRAEELGLKSIKIVGLILVHPFFVNAKPARMMEFIYPGMRERENERRVNPGKDLDRLVKLGCRRVVVFVAEKDRYRDRGIWYIEMLRKSGWKGEVELVESDGEDHVFHLFRPESEKAEAMVTRIVDFVNQIPGYAQTARM